MAAQQADPLRRGGAAALDPAAARRTAGAATYFLLVLTAVYCFAFVDRQIFNMLVAPIKRDFAVSDLQVSYLIGPAFIFSFMAVGLPAGWAVDRFHRRNLVLGAGVLWSAATMASALADSYVALMATRALVGASEAVLFPAGMSLIADLFERRRLPVANSVFLASPYLGGGLALIVGGLMLDRFEAIPAVDVPLLGAIRGWQLTLVLVGFAGLLPLLLLLGAREPARERDAGGQVTRLGPRDGVSYMREHWRFYLFFYLGMGLAGLVMQMVTAWAPTYLGRTFALAAKQIGPTYGSYVLIAGLLGGFSGPLFNRWLARDRAGSTMLTACLGPVLVLVAVGAFALAATPGATMLALALFTFAYAFPLSVAGTSLQVMTPPGLRGFSSAVYLVCNSIVGYALGPTTAPAVARWVLGDPRLIGDAMALVAIVCGTAALACLLVSWRAFVGYRAGAVG